MLFLHTPAAQEQVFVEGGDDPVPGELPQPWALERFQTLAEPAQRTGTIVQPEPQP